MNFLNRFAVVALLSFFILPILANQAPARDISVPSSPDARVIEIADDSGGVVVDYAVRMFRLKQDGTKVRFRGRCDSACTLFLALPQDQTCLHEGAVFRFHAPSSTTTSEVDGVSAFLMQKYPPWVRAWISANGGLSHRLISMDYTYARQYVRACA